MEKPKILIADSLEEFREALADGLQQAANVKISVDGQQTLALLSSLRPDTLVLEIELPGLDGISLIQRMIGIGHRPMVLATTRCNSAYVVDTCDQLGVDYIIMRPCEIRSTIDRVLDLCDRRKASHRTIHEPTILLSRMLLRMGLANRHHGCLYLHEAILLMSRNRGQAITKELYPTVAAVFRVNVGQIETGIRRALHLAWEHRDNEIWKEFLEPDENGSVPRPSSGDFICRMADLLLLQLREGIRE